MGEIIEFRDRVRNPPGNLITLRPWEFRRADWKTAHFIQMLKSEGRKLETHRKKVCKKGGKGIWHLPAHYQIKGGSAQTVRALFDNRENEETMRRVYFLAGLTDCMINQISPILRTDLIRAMYKKVFALKDALNVHWVGPIDKVLLPLDSQFYNEEEYRLNLRKAGTMKELYQAIRKGTDEMFDILSLEYVFYCPGRG